MHLPLLLLAALLASAIAQQCAPCSGPNDCYNHREPCGLYCRPSNESNSDSGPIFQCSPPGECGGNCSSSDQCAGECNYCADIGLYVEGVGYCAQMLKCSEDCGFIRYGACPSSCPCTNVQHYRFCTSNEATTEDLANLPPRRR